MAMSYMQFMKTQNKDQERQIEVELTKLSIESALSLRGYVADDADKSTIKELVTNIVNKSIVTRGFKRVSQFPDLKN